jgi:hypothetical protein
MSLPGTSTNAATAPPAADANEPILVYRPRASVVVAASALAIVLALLAGAGVAVAIGAAATGDATVATAALLEVVLVVPFVLLLWRQSRIRLEVGPTTVLAVNYFSSFSLRWQDIVRFTAGTASIGIVAELRDGSTVRLSAIQQPNLAAHLGAPTDADDAVLELNRWLYRLRWETTSRRRASQAARRPDAERDHGEDDRRGGEPVPQEEPEIATP